MTYLGWHLRKNVKLKALQGNTGVSFPWLYLRYKGATKKVCVLCFNSSIKENSNGVQYSKWSLPIIYWYCMCKRSEESIEHLLLHCPVATDIWSSIFVLCGISWEMLRIVIETLKCLQERFHQQSLKDLEGWPSLHHVDNLEREILKARIK